MLRWREINFVIDKNSLGQALWCLKNKAHVGCPSVLRHHYIIGALISSKCLKFCFRTLLDLPWVPIDSKPNCLWALVHYVSFYDVSDVYPTNNIDLIIYIEILNYIWNNYTKSIKDSE